MPGTLVISLDFELAWGIPAAEHARWRGNLLGARAAVPALLELFARHELRATWATVGGLFADGRDALRDALPPARVTGLVAGRDPARHLAALGRSEADAPLHFAPTLIRQILATPGQELGSHTLLHAPALEGLDRDARLRDDLDAAQRLAVATTGEALQSLVFPYNQMDAASVAVACAAGFRAYRSNVPLRPFAPVEGWTANAWRRGFRWVDQVAPLAPADALLAPAPTPVAAGRIAEVRASRFLRPGPWPSAALARRAQARTCALLTDAAARDRVVHLWTHPHNFGVDTRARLAWLEGIVAHASRLRQTHGLTSATMAEMVAPLSATASAPPR
jgi:peptidoglycan/xylan/chitin deacetylase (PgdA/CDA1 family)